MTATRRTPVVYGFADDLSGAAETVAALGLRTSRNVVHLASADAGSAGAGSTRAGRPDQVGPPAARGNVVVDLDSRRSGPTASVPVVERVLEGSGPADLVFQKVDSLLRGDPGAHLDLLRRGGPVVVAVALPVANRTVRDGVLYVGGHRLPDSSAWRAESRPAPSTVAQALGSAVVRAIPLTTVRGGTEVLRRALEAATVDGAVPVCDGETDADLDAVVRAALQLSGVRLIGCGGLAAAVGRFLEERAEPEPLPTGSASDGGAAGAAGADTAPLPASHRVLVATASAEPVVREQLEELAGPDAGPGAPQWLGLDVDELLTEPTGQLSEAVARALAVGDVALSIGTTDRIDPERSAAIVARLAEVVADAVRRAEGAVPLTPGGISLALTGGETARRVLDALEVSQLVPVTQIHHGAVRLRDPGGRHVVIRPGSFGTRHSLQQIVSTLRKAPR